MTDSVTLYRLDNLLPVGEFVSRPWCKTHDSPLEPSMERCVEVRLWRAFGDVDRPEDWDPIADCERVDRLVQVIPDDH